MPVLRTLRYLADGSRRASSSFACRCAIACAVLLCPAVHAEAYIGPGAGFVFISSFLAIFTTILAAFVSLLLWPIRMGVRALRRPRSVKPLVRRLVILGFDGQDPQLTDRFLAEGKLPNFARLAAMGTYQRLRTTFPSVSPVAWSTFSTGVQPARHNIFDFLGRDRRTYLPVLSTAHVGRARRVLKLGRFRVPLRAPELRLLRKSKPFWCILSEHHIWSTVLRVPVTFPPDRFHGAELSAMSVPDLLGTQGTFTLLTTRSEASEFKEGGHRVQLKRNGTRFEGVLQGPPNTLVESEPTLSVDIAIERESEPGRARVEINGHIHSLRTGALSDWIHVTFHAAPLVNIAGICRMLLLEAGDEVSLYVTAINIDPEKPAMPISHPPYYASYLAKKIGPYSTLGLAEDTWALNEGVINEAAFLQHAYSIDAERQRMLFAALATLDRGSLTCVFDATDRIQHMFWRYLDPSHPAAIARTDAECSEAIERLYVHNDALVGKVMARLTEKDVLMVLSDHGFTSFRRGVNLNSWLYANGYLTLKHGANGLADWLRDVDWSHTRAYALGLTGLFLNVRGREAQGIVAPGEEVSRLKKELIAKLNGLVDHDRQSVAVCEVFDTQALYSGPYLENAPDLLLGYNAGYRTSWDCAMGVVSAAVFEDNVKPWSGDHCVDPRQVPGVVFCNRAMSVPDPALVDIAPTVLHLFGIEAPSYMEGKVLIGPLTASRE